MIAESNSLYSFFISESGGLLGLLEETSPLEQDQLRLFNLESGQILTINLEAQRESTIDLTLDERWLMILDQGVLRVINLDTNDIATLPAAAFGGCFDAAWIAPTS